MASRETDTQKLNSTFKLLGERGIEGEIWKKHTEHCLVYLLRQLSEFFSEKFDNCMVFQAYGSAVEDLKSIAPDDVGDVDIVICPKSNELMIDDEMIEYSTNPMHVRIKAVDHQILSSCLVEDTEYVATSALKNFHSTIFGRAAPHLVKALIQTMQNMPRIPGFNVLKWQNKDASPALQIEYTQSFGPISGKIEKLNNPHSLPNFDAAEWEWLAHIISRSRGMEYSEDHANLIREYIEFSNEVQMSFSERGLLSKPEAFPLLMQELVFSDRARNFKERCRDIETRMQNKSGSRNDGVTEMKYSQTENYNENESGSSEEKGTSQSQGDDQPSVTTETADDTPEPECTSLQKPVASTSGEHSHSSGSGMAKQSTEVKTDQEYKRRQTESEDEDTNGEIQSKIKEKLGFQRETAPKANPPDKGEDLETVLSQTDHFFQQLFPEAATNSISTEKSSTVGGFDLVPAFKCSGWPKTATEWIGRERKWPSPDVVTKVVKEGFHLVVKPPKDGGNQECDFRISFSNAEYLLSQQVNDIQRDCYRCLKTFYRGYLKASDGPKGLVTFHLKNILLQTIEETDAEMWNESNRAKCMMLLLGKLLQALIDRDLRHYFVRSYNLFSGDYIEDPEVLDTLAEKVVEIIEDPIKVAKDIQETENWVQKEYDAEQEHRKEQSTSHESYADERKASSLSSAPATKGATRALQASKGYRFHDLRKIYLATGQELIDKAFKEDALLEISEVERRIVDDLREMIEKHKMTAEDFSKIFERYWDLAYLKVSHIFGKKILFHNTTEQNVMKSRPNTDSRNAFNIKNFVSHSLVYTITRAKNCLFKVI